MGVSEVGFQLWEIANVRPECPFSAKNWGFRGKRMRGQRAEGQAAQLGV